MSEENVRSRGVVVHFNDIKGYGFVRPDGGGEDLFVHYSDIKSAFFRTLHKGQVVDFAIESILNKAKAVDVTPLNGGDSGAARGSGGGSYRVGYGGGVFCYNCGGYDHFDRDCTSGCRGVEIMWGKGGSCGEDEHMARDCPKRGSVTKQEIEEEKKLVELERKIKEETKLKELRQRIEEENKLKELGLSHLQGKYLYIVFEESSEYGTEKRNLSGNCLCDKFGMYYEKPPTCHIVVERLAASKLIIKQNNNPPLEQMLNLNKEFPNRLYSRAVMFDSKIHVVGGSIPQDDSDEDVSNAEHDSAAAEYDSDDSHCEMKPYPGVTSIEISNEGECRWLGHDVVAQMGQGKGNPLLVELEIGEEDYDLCDLMKKKIYALPGIPNYDSDDELKSSRDSDSDSEESFYSDDLKFEAYDPITNKWETIMPPPPFLNLDSYKEGGYLGAVVLNNKLHVSTRYNAYCFDPENNSWGLSHLFADFPFTLYGSSHFNPSDSPAFEVRGKGLVLLDGKVLIGSCAFEGYWIYAYLIDDEGKASHCQTIGCINKYHSNKDPPRYVDLGCDADGWAYFCIVSYHEDSSSSVFCSSIGIDTYKIKILNEGERSSELFLDVQAVSTYAYDDLEEDYEVEHFLKDPIGCFLVSASGCAELPEGSEGSRRGEEQCRTEIV